MPPAKRALTTSSGALHFTRAGSGSPCILLHGLGSSQQAFSESIPLLARHHEVFAIDLLGHGDSEMNALDLSPAGQAEAILQLIHDLRLEGLTLVGHSLGGSAAVHIAAALPERVRKMVLISAGCYEIHLPIAWRLLRSRFLWGALGLVGPLRAWALRRAARLLYTQPAAMEQRLMGSRAATRQGWNAAGRAFRQSTSEAALSGLERLVEVALPSPTLVIWGSDDRLVPVTAARALFLEKESVRFIEVAWGSHGLLEEDTGIVNDLILDFLG
jgi:4,5:9,10-diseco-3-hydroxy-5,9,17-trioxoandrosta-1(10),2-diene-4-oate hydrolase